MRSLLKATSTSFDPFVHPFNCLFNFPLSALLHQYQRFPSHQQQPQRFNHRPITQTLLLPINFLTITINLASTMLRRRRQSRSRSHREDHGSNGCSGSAREEWKMMLLRDNRGWWWRTGWRWRMRLKLVLDNKIFIYFSVIIIWTESYSFHKTSFLHVLLIVFL